ncbi:MAG: MarR family transcriptional regulator [Oscillospiraceae bacterium]|nr:MarR family transcriptional regulator [Oscillospiraceae bacterium]
MINRFEQFTAAISSIHRFVQKIERDEMAKYGLKGAAAQYLLAMSRYPEGITAASLCEVCDRDKAAVSRILGEMEAKGLVTRVGGDNAYRALLALTPAGQQAADFVNQKASLAAELAGKDMTDQERAILYATLDRISTNIKSLSNKGIPDKK